MIAFEEKVRLGGVPALDEYFKFFSNGERLRDSFFRLAGRLNELKIPYAMMGGAALAVHGACCGTRDLCVLIGTETTTTEIGGVCFINLESFIEYKLASGMNQLALVSELADVIELIKARNLDKEFALKLNPNVREKYLELCRAVQNEPAMDE